MSRQRVEVDHRVVVHEAETRADHAGRSTERMCERHAPAGAVDHGDMGGSRRTGRHEVDHDLPAGLDHRPPLGSTLLGGHPVQRDIDEIRVAEVAVPVGERGLHRQPDPQDVRRGVVAELGQVPALEDVEDLDEGRSTVRRRAGRDRVAAVGAGDRLDVADPVAGEVRGRHERTAGRQIRGDPCPELAGVEVVGAGLADPA